ncbi:MAG: TetR/AcrR family transcriptional regulator [Myxococcota bacterium]|nr:TetR/AcrR family transcriptional regulator [Myxococcales bacterium]
MSSRSAQRDATRERIVEAALAAFAENGFLGASTRDIALRAGANQGLITYHFRTKDELWRAAVDRVFARLRAHLGAQLAASPTSDPREAARAAVRAYVEFAAACPELFRLLVDEGKNDDERMAWLVDTHLEPLYTTFLLGSGAGAGGGGPAGDPVAAAHTYYVLAGAASLIFAVAPECRRLTGVDPATPAAVARHADLVARVLVP